MPAINTNGEVDCFKAELSLSDFKTFSDYIYSEFGIKMPEIKRIMLQGRLLKRIRELKMTSYSEYKNYFFSPEGQKNELYNFLSVITTNKTDFFREPVHFDFLSKEVLPQFVAKGGRNIKIWSAACSSGEELYTISIVLNEFIERNPQLSFSLLGTDISSNVLDKAVHGVYGEKSIEGIPLMLKKKYFLKSKDRKKAMVRVTPQLQKNISLKYLNLMDAVYDITEKYDVIFCRNVLIYFDRETQEKVINKLCRHLADGGYLFIGHSESMANMSVPLTNIQPTIFKKI
ncbi:MAG: hypothetical protein J6Y82_00820 [Bacteroidales bacterium]|nr:hypothetical protein [Bacteroidales bacterium]